MFSSTSDQSKSHTSRVEAGLVEAAICGRGAAAAAAVVCRRRAGGGRWRRRQGQRCIRDAQIAADALAWAAARRALAPCRTELKRSGDSAFAACRATRGMAHAINDAGTPVQGLQLAPAASAGSAGGGRCRRRQLSLCPTLVTPSQPSRPRRGSAPGPFPQPLTSVGACASQNPRPPWRTLQRLPSCHRTYWSLYTDTSCLSK